MAKRLVAIDEGSDILLDRAMMVIGRHPQCDARLDSLRISRRHCCMAQDNDDVVVRDLGSTNGIRINGQRVESGRLRKGDELSIAHIRFRFENNAPGQKSNLEARATERNEGPLNPVLAAGLAVGSQHMGTPFPMPMPLATPRPSAIPMATPRPAPMPVGTPMPLPLPDGVVSHEIQASRDNSLVAAFRKALPPDLNERGIEIVVRVPPAASANGTAGEDDAACPPVSSP